MNFELKIDEYKNSFEKFLQSYLYELKYSETKLIQSIKYSLLSSGKRIRPIIMLAVYELFGGKSDDIYRFAIALEMIHTYSLIHDDLPCIDDDTYRRDNLCNHIVYGEDTALLAGDALLTLAFEVISVDCLIDFNLVNVLKSINILSKAIGCSGMVLGQSFDLTLDKNAMTLKDVLNIYKLKTANLIAVSAEIGAILAGASQKQVDAVKNYGINLGICFQLVDDVIDKDIFSISAFKDLNLKKIISQFVSSAKKELVACESDTSFLKDLVDYLTSRVY